MDEQLQQIIRDVCAGRDAPVVELEAMPDHVHLLVACDPLDGLHRLVTQIKGRSSRLCAGVPALARYHRAGVELNRR